LNMGWQPIGEDNVFLWEDWDGLALQWAEFFW
jgi:hypothetical protein